MYKYGTIQEPQIVPDFKNTNTEPLNLLSTMWLEC